jgi:penicillin amidase
MILILDLSLPSIWYELQLSTPSSNVYGVSLPGSPFVVIGFNDSIAWGLTNAQRDVKDYYSIKFKDNSKKEYWHGGKWQPTTVRIEEIKIKGAPSVYDTVAYTEYGPVMFDESFSEDSLHQPNLALRWTAHDPSNEGMTLYKLNRAEKLFGLFRRHKNICVSRSKFCVCFKGRRYRHLATGKVSCTLGGTGALYHAG